MVDAALVVDDDDDDAAAAYTFSLLTSKTIKLLGNRMTRYSRKSRSGRIKSAAEARIWVDDDNDNDDDVVVDVVVVVDWGVAKVDAVVVSSDDSVNSTAEDRRADPPEGTAANDAADAAADTNDADDCPETTAPNETVDES